MDKSDIEYKLSMLNAMLKAETEQEGEYGAHLTHWYGTAKPINLDASAIRALIQHYENELNKF